MASSKKGGKKDSTDMDQVQKIVDKMKKKYATEGVEVKGGEYSELTGLVAEGKIGKLEVQKVEDLKESDSKAVSLIGKIYLSLKKIIDPVYKIFSTLPIYKKLDFELYSANMRFSAKQWIAISSVIALLITLLVFSILALTALLFELNFLMIIALSFIVFVLASLIVPMVPSYIARVRGHAISAELPFALRHIATQLSAGIGLYRTLQAIAKSDYGPLSQEFAKTITEIEEGTDTQDALRHLALRTKSNALRNAMMHTIRALKTGGNLSNVMNDIAEDVSFQLRTNMREFGQKMNFIGVFFIFLAIVLPVFVAILGAIRNAPIGAAGGISFEMIPLDLNMMALIYLLVMPLFLIWIFFMIKLMQPRA